ncbi:MAG: hypothetical protein CH6_1115 [Candidatus Kapaibacterium sp.]|nr:MAG: hypothetical protein CH6_1115 [Candidatus Kapabacteria bacterium]ROL55930.1 MAG: hypothetical protein D9V84_09830 [Bacteroidetes/Chlorobi group bacterium Naka2016]
MTNWLKNILALVIALAISYIIFYSFFAMLGLAFKLIINLFHLILIVLVALPFYVLIRKKVLK